MGLLLLLAGLLAIAGGVGAFAYGALNPEFRGLDATGATVAVVGGLALAGLGTVVARLRRIAEAIEAQSFHVAPATLEPRIPAATSMGAAAVAAALGEPVGGPLPAEQLSFAPPPFGVAPEPKVEFPRHPEPPAHTSLDDAASPPSLVSDPVPRGSRIAAENPAEWPSIDAGDRIQPMPAALPIAESAPSPRIETARPPLSDAVILGLEAVEVSPPAMGQTASGPQVLKSGVIEGMAYTLYSDGSVDAELSAGTRRFASIAEWRAYLRESV